MKTIQYYQRKKRVLRLLRGSMVFLLCVIFITPFIVMISTSFRTNSDAFTKLGCILRFVLTAKGCTALNCSLSSRQLKK